MSLIEFLARRFDMVPLAGVRRMEVEHRAQKAALRDVIAVKDAEIDHLRAENHELRGQRDVCQLMWAGEAKKVADICPLLDAIEVAPWLDGMGEEMYAALTALVKWRAELPSPPASR